jgi:dihydrofolate reductase
MLVRSLLQDGLLDELKLMIHPVILGKGKRLFTEDLDLKKLQLVDSKVTGTGIVILTYQPATSENEK